jgi:uroporphyrinogen-III decarboxylase
MKAKEYDELIDYPKKWIVEKLLTRSMRNLGNPGSAKTMHTLYKWGYQNRIEINAGIKLRDKLKKLGFPNFSNGISYAPLDFIGDFLRDIKNVILDTHRVPNKVVQACEAIKVLIFEMAEIQAKISPKGTRIFIPLHLNEYFSPRQYGEFYWPTLKDVVNKLISLEMVPLIFYEGNHEANLETILELPKGKTISRFEKTDLVKAKDIIGSHSSIVGGPPPSLFLGSSEKLNEYVKNLLDDMKPNGGYIMSPAVTIPATAKTENIRALHEAVEKHGKY